MLNLEDIIGKKFGTLTVLEFDHNDSSYNHYYKCKCDCGNIITRERKDLLSDPFPKCKKCKGEESGIERAKENVGKKYGKLEIIEFIKRNNRINYYKCRCDCGNIETVRGFDLSSGKITECKKCRKKIREENTIDEMIGKKFGDLEVVGFDRHLSDGRFYYTCRCKCGNTTVKEVRDLRRGSGLACSECLIKTKYPQINPGDKFGELTVLSIGKNVNGNQYYNCKCSCGEEVERLKRDLINGKYLSCRKCLYKNQGIENMSDIVGMKFGSLTVKGINRKDSNGAYYYDCQCDCGDTAVRERRTLLKSKPEILKCDKCKLVKSETDLIGRAFGQLIVTGFCKRNQYGAIYYNCKCSCGKIVIAERGRLLRGETTRCSDCRIKALNDKIENLVGQKFGKLTILGRCDNKGNNIYYKCQCDCGNIIEKSRSDIINMKNLQCTECYKRKKLQEQINECIGKKYGRLLVESFAELKDAAGRPGEHEIIYNCKCDCGKRSFVPKRSLKSGATVSCGCYNREKLLEVNTIHGMSDDPFYQVYNDMKNRCFNENNDAYHNYGARGILVCERWLNQNEEEAEINAGFLRFKEDMYESYLQHKELYPNDTSLDRIDNDWVYCKENCRWATMEEQSNNTRINNHYIYYGVPYTIREIINNFAKHRSYYEIRYGIDILCLKDGDELPNNFMLLIVSQFPINIYNCANIKSFLYNIGRI